MVFPILINWSQVPLKPCSLSLRLINLSIRNFSLSCPLWPQACACWMLINQSQMTKITVVVDNIIAVLKLMLWTLSLTHKLRLFLWGKMSLQMPEPWITGPENCKPETSWPSKLQIKKRQKMTVNLGLFVLFFKKCPNSQTRLEWLVPHSLPRHSTNKALHFAANTCCQFLQPGIQTHAWLQNYNSIIPMQTKISSS